MEVGTVMSFDLGDRMDAGFHLLRVKHADLVIELMTKFDRAALVILARSLPVHTVAFHTVCRPAMPAKTAFDRARFDAWLNNERSAKFRDLAVYCAAAAQDTASKILNEVVALSEQKMAKLNALQDLLNRTEGADSPLLLAAMKGNAKVPVDGA